MFLKIYFDVEYIYGFVGWVSASKVDDVTALPCRADDVTASHIKDGGYALLWQRYENNKIAAICYYGNVMATKIYTSSVYDCTVEDVEYIYNKFGL